MNQAEFQNWLDQLPDALEILRRAAAASDEARTRQGARHAELTGMGTLNQALQTAGRVGPEFAKAIRTARGRAWAGDAALPDLLPDLFAALENERLTSHQGMETRKIAGANRVAVRRAADAYVAHCNEQLDRHREAIRREPADWESIADDAHVRVLVDSGTSVLVDMHDWPNDLPFDDWFEQWAEAHRVDWDD